MFASFDRGLAPLRGEVSPEWGANHQNHRQKLKLAAQVPVGGAQPSLLVCDESSPGGATLVYSSVSHAPDLGGYVGFTAEHPQTLQVGFDIEGLERVEESVVERVRHSKDELPGFSDVAALRWSAKEAAFKALAGDSQPQVISQIILFDWILREHNIAQFSFRTSFSSAGIGYGWDDGTHQFAIAFWQPESQIETGLRK